jgi:hypothetical protein
VISVPHHNTIPPLKSPRIYQIQISAKIPVQMRSKILEISEPGFFRAKEQLKQQLI